LATLTLDAARAAVRINGDSGGRAFSPAPEGAVDQLPANYANLGIAGVLALAFIGAHLYTLKALIPAMLQRFSDELAAERAANGKHIEALLGRIDSIETKVDGLTRQGDRRPFVRDYGEDR
jgi:hypothetical protein